MENDRNYAGYANIMNANCTYPTYDNKCEHMKPYMFPKCNVPCESMYGNYMHMNQCENMHMGHCDNMQMNPYYRHDMHMHMNMNPYNMQKMEPIENMCGKTYKILMVHVDKTMNKIAMENMGVMPKSISKEKFNKEMNYMICEVMKQEDEIKKIIVVDRSETEDSEDMSRAFCPYCGGMLKDTLSILFVTELLKRGCTNCH